MLIKSWQLQVVAIGRYVFQSWGKFTLDYQPLFGKMSPHSSGRIKDRTRETVEIEPRVSLDALKRMAKKLFEK